MGQIPVVLFITSMRLSLQLHHDGNGLVAANISIEGDLIDVKVIELRLLPNVGAKVVL